MSQNKQMTENIINTIAKHPYLSMFLVCLMANLLCFGSEGNIPQNALDIEIMIVLIISLLFCHCMLKNYGDKINFISGEENKISHNAMFTSVLEYTVLLLFAAYRYTHSQYKGVWIFVVGTILLLMLCASLYSEKLKMQVISLAIIGESFLVKFYYIFYTSVYTRQNDVGAFGSNSGHFGYIEYILFNHKLPDFDPREVWTFCHPPLHHFLSAVWIGINQYVLGVDKDASRESLQTLTLFYSMVVIIAAYKILRYFKLKGISLYIPLMIVAFHPSFTYLAGSVNNDILSIALMMCAIVCTMRWYEEQNIRNILKIALCIGFAMMTKLSAGLIAPSVAVVFLYVLIKNGKNNIKKYIIQFSAFGIVCVPLGLWFEIKNLIKYKMPITYVQEVASGVPQDISDQKFLNRITDFSAKHFKNVFEQWLSIDANGKKIGFNENNPIISLFKTSIFGEYVNENTFGDNKFALALCKPYFWLCIILAISLFVIMIIALVKAKNMQPIWKIFFVLFYVFMMLNIYKMSADYPMVCTMNFRYITPTVIVQALFGGIWLASYRGQVAKENCGMAYGKSDMLKGKADDVFAGEETAIAEEKETVSSADGKTGMIEEKSSVNDESLDEVNRNKKLAGKILLAMTLLYAVMGTYIWMVVCYNTRG